VTILQRYKSLAAIGLIAGASLIGGCGDSEGDFVFTPSTVSNVAAPQAVDDSITALGNASLEQDASNGVLVNDTPNGANISAFDTTSDQGGTVVLNADGSFTYTAPDGFRGTDSFDYTLSNSGGNSTATVTLDVTSVGFFVDNSAGSNGIGTEADPYDNLNDALTDPFLSAGDTIFVFEGTGTSLNQSGAFTLPQGVRLVGEGEGLIATQTVVPQGQLPVLEGPITLSGDNVVAGFLIQNSSAEGITANGVSEILIGNNTFRTPTEEHIQLSDVGGEVTISGNNFEPNTQNFDYINFDNQDTDVNLLIGANNFTDDGSNQPDQAVQLFIEGNSMAEIAFNLNQVSSTGLTNAFSPAFDLQTYNTSQTMLSVSNNLFTRVGPTAIAVDTNNTSSVSGQIVVNEINNTADDAIILDSESFAGVQLDVGSNVINSAGDEGIALQSDLDGELNCTLSQNEITNSAGDAIFATLGPNAGASAQLVASVTGSLLEDSGGSSINATRVSGASGDFCMDIEQNVVNDDMLFDDQDNSQGIDVEEFNQLNTVNNFNAGAPVEQSPGNDVNSVADGFCQTL